MGTPISLDLEKQGARVTLWPCCHCLHFKKKGILWAKEENYENSSISPSKIYNLPKKRSSKRIQNPSRYIL
jgi:hypothetical protein